MRTYWVYDKRRENGGVPIAAVRAEEPASENTIRGIAVAQVDRNPGIFLVPGQLPDELRSRIRYGVVYVERYGRADGYHDNLVRVG